jgi:hypothetical protein
MKKLPVVLVLLLTIVWAYTCWYWYTCNIKWFCDGDSTYTVSQVREEEESDVELITEDGATESGIIINDSEGSPKLSAADVLFDPLPKEVEQEEQEEEIQDDDESTQSWSIADREWVENEETQENSDEEELSTSTDICESPLVGAIALWGDNNINEVKKLEAFLVSRWESITVDGVYENEDSEAVKRFQLEYKADVLDPWDITTPTWYVWRTSIAKINELACK